LALRAPQTYDGFPGDGGIMREILVGLTLLMSFGSSVCAQTLNENRASCDSKEPDVSIPGCTALIQSGKETNPGNLSVAYYNRAAVYFFKGMLDPSPADFNKGIALKPDDPNTFLGRGVVYLKKERYDQAISDFTRTIALQPDRANAYSVRGQTYEKKNERDNAVADYRAALKLNPNDKSAKEALERLK
jgi:tetratricopeptide (TPR) repeat protein